MITGFIRGQRLTLCSPPTVGGTWESLSARFVFETGEWDGLIRYAHFRREGDAEELILPIPAEGVIGEHLNLGAGIWHIWVHGDAVAGGTVTARLTTGVADLTVKETGAEDPLPLSPTYGEQVLAQVISVKQETKELLDGCEEAVVRMLAAASDEIDGRFDENEEAVASVLGAAGKLVNTRDG